jgi:hypothetical protein
MIFIHHRPYGSYAMEEGRRYLSVIDTSYALGYIEAQYPVPAVIVRVGWQPKGAGIMQDIPYWWVCSEKLLWTFWRTFGLIVERA